MPREIKFRAWTGIEMMEPALECKKVGVVLLNEWLRPHPPAVLMQFTGLHDKNGKEIFEGDIVKTNDSVGSISWEPNLLRWQIDFVDENVGDALGDYWQHLLPEVIGNIYENKELIDNK